MRGCMTPSPEFSQRTVNDTGSDFHYHLWGRTDYHNFGDYCMCQWCVYYRQGLEDGCPIHNAVIEFYHHYRVRAPIFECQNFKRKLENGKPEYLRFPVYGTKEFYWPC